MHSVNPDVQFRGNCIQQAISYIQWRLGQMRVGLTRKVGVKPAVWFFQTELPNQVGTVDVDKDGRYRMARPYWHKRQLLRTWEF